MNSFEDVLYSPTEDAYIDVVLEFMKVCARWPRFVKYIETNVLDTDKERVVHVGIDSLCTWTILPQIELNFHTMS
jgi:hypothetical protein